MGNRKEVIWTVCTVLVIILAGSTFWFLSHHKKAVMDFGATSTAASNPSSSLTPSNSNLQVNSGSTASNLGQLGTSSQSGISGSQNSSSNSSSSAGSTSSPVNPSTFSQYNQYANNSTALFGDIQVGNGATLGNGQQATITYKGWLTDGTLFDQSQTNSSGQLVPLSFTLGGNQIIQGLQEGVDGMKVGGSRLVIIPPSLGYGSQGKSSIPPNSVLVFEVNLLDVN